MTNAAAEKKSLVEEPQMRAPKKGDRLRCQKCGMEILVTVDCKSGDGHHARFECCGQPLAQL
jgi:hypothetical protein